jgi:hypothetical protein
VTTASQYTDARRNASTAAPRTPLREIIAELASDLAERIEHRAGVRHLVRLALGMHRAGAEGFAGVEPLLLVAELAELARFEEPAP